MTKSGIIKLADLGLSRSCSLPFKNLTEECLTILYRSPEVILGHTNYGTNIDIWPIGCIFYDLVFACHTMLYHVGFGDITCFYTL